MSVIIQQAITDLLTQLDEEAHYWIAYSGGMDSHVLLHALSQLSVKNLTAIHIDHGLSPNASAWSEHCQQTCSQLGVAYESHRVTLHKEAGSLENQAREARYAVFNQRLGSNDFLLMAHHQDDQMETMLYRLMRGAGPKGLAAIPVQRDLENAQLLRPFLSIQRVDINAYAQAHDLAWIEDESNFNTDFDRNYLRQEVFPLLQKRWPNFQKSWQRSAQLCDEADQLQTILGKQDLLKVQAERVNQLDITALGFFNEVRLRNILRVWFASLNKTFNIIMPDFNSLQQIVNELIPAAQDATPLVSWGANTEQVSVRRFANKLIVLKGCAVQSQYSDIRWLLPDALELPERLGALSLNPTKHNGIDLSKVDSLCIKFRQGGEQAKPAGRKTRSLKKIFQDYGIPPWLRDCVPLIYSGEELVAVADLFICEKWLAEEGENLTNFCWQRSDIHCGY